VISSCPTRYIPGDQVRAVDKRSRELPREYLRKARDVDRVYCGIPEGERGPVENHLQQFGDLRGLVFGAFGEASQDVHKLVQVMAESRLRSIGLQRGREGGEGELSVIVGQIRKQLSVAAVGSQSDCLLARPKFTPVCLFLHFLIIPNKKNSN